MKSNFFRLRMIKRPGMNITQIACSGGGGGGNSWDFLVVVCRPVLQILTKFQTKKNVIFHTRFQTWPLKSLPVWSQTITLHVCTEINYVMSVIIAEIKIATKRLLKIPRQNPF